MVTGSSFSSILGTMEVRQKSEPNPRGVGPKLTLPLEQLFTEKQVHSGNLHCYGKPLCKMRKHNSQDY